MKYHPFQNYQETEQILPENMRHLDHYGIHFCDAGHIFMHNGKKALEWIYIAVNCTSWLHFQEHNFQALTFATGGGLIQIIALSIGGTIVELSVRWFKSNSKHNNY